MKNKFELSSEEIKRILSLHESAAKRHYLSEQYNPIYNQQMEKFRQSQTQQQKTQQPQQNTKQQVQTLESYTTKNDLTLEQDVALTSMLNNPGNEIKLFKGATFVKSTKNPKMLVSTNAVFQFVDSTSGKLAKSWDAYFSVIPTDTKSATFYGSKGDYLYYGCDTGKFTTNAARKGNQNVNFYAEDGASVGLVNILKKVCAYQVKPKTQIDNNKNQKPETQIDNSKKPQLTPEQKLKRANGCGFKTWDEYAKSGWKCIPPNKDNKVVQKQPKPIKLNPSEEEQCQLLGDETYSYAKQKNRWFYTIDNVNWYEITNNKKAVTILTDPTKGCKNIKELVAFIPPPVTDVDFSQVPIETQVQNTTAKTNTAPDQDNEERPA
jgi:hypothetical protein